MGGDRTIGYAVAFLGCGAGGCCVFLSAVSTVFWAKASASYMAIELAFVAPGGLNYVFAACDMGACNKDSFSE